ncbi:hypothetical protein ACJX0J_007497 [Zea mays]
MDTFSLCFALEAYNVNEVGDIRLVHIDFLIEAYSAYVAKMEEAKNYIDEFGLHEYTYLDKAWESLKVGNRKPQINVIYQVPFLGHTISNGVVKIFGNGWILLDLEIATIKLGEEFDWLIWKKIYVPNIKEIRESEAEILELSMIQKWRWSKIGMDFLYMERITRLCHIKSKDGRIWGLGYVDSKPVDVHNVFYVTSLFIADKLVVYQNYFYAMSLCLSIESHVKLASRTVAENVRASRTVAENVYSMNPNPIRYNILLATWKMGTLAEGHECMFMLLFKKWNIITNFYFKGSQVYMMQISKSFFHFTCLVLGYMHHTCLARKIYCTRLYDYERATTNYTLLDFRFYSFEFRCILEDSQSIYTLQQ